LRERPVSLTSSPAIAAVGLPNRIVICAHVTTPRQTFIIELPMFVAVGAIPLSGGVVPFVLEAQGDSIARKVLELLHQGVVQFFFPPSFRNDLIASRPLKKFRSVPPIRIFRIRLRYGLWTAAIPGVLCCADFGPSRCERDWGVIREAAGVT